MSHELGTPLNAILGYTQKLKRDGQLKAEQVQAATVIYDNGVYLLGMINDLLDLSKAEARKLTLERHYFDFPHFLNNLRAMFHLRVVEKERLEFGIDLPTPIPAQIRTDEKRLRQVLVNLLGNAIKFTDAGVITLRIGAACHPNSITAEGELATLHFTVTDTGIGMNEEQLQRIFLPFEQAGDVGMQAQGTGLGLALVRELVEVMGGEIRVHSVSGQGSIFQVDLTVPVIWSRDDGVPAQELIATLGPVPFSGPRLESNAAPEIALFGPGMSDLRVLYDYAMKGELLNIKDHAQRMAADDPRLHAFDARIQDLVDAYDDEAIRSLLKEIMAAATE